MRTSKRALSLSVVVSGVLSLATTGCGGGGGQAARLPAAPLSPATLNPTYHGGLLLQHVRVATLFWGQSWDQSRLPDYFDRFFQVLFADGRYMANLSQYSAGGYQIGDGEFIGTATDSAAPPAKVTDAQIRAEIARQIVARKLPAPGPDTLYFVFTPPQVEVEAFDAISGEDFSGYHSYASDAQGRGFAYSAIPYSADQAGLTTTISHELAEAVTDPQPTQSTAGWYALDNAEVADALAALYNANRIRKDDYLDVLTGPDGAQYVVQKVWSAKDGAPVAFARSVHSH